MSKIYFKYGTMGSGKSLDLIRTVYNYNEKGKDAYVCKPRVDTREGIDNCIIKSRTGASVEAKWFDINDVKSDSILEYDVIIVDEAQFLSKNAIREINDMVRVREGFPSVIFYGLKTDFRGILFPAVEVILALADSIEENVSLCECGKKARQNVRYINGLAVFNGDLVQIGGNESYGAVCNTCFVKLQEEFYKRTG